MSPKPETITYSKVSCEDVGDQVNSDMMFDRCARDAHFEAGCCAHQAGNQREGRNFCCGIKKSHNDGFSGYSWMSRVTRVHGPGDR